MGAMGSSPHDARVAPTLGWSVWQSSDVVVVHASGEVDLSNATELEYRLAALSVVGAHRIVVDLSEITFIDVIGFNTLLRAQRLARANGQELRVRRPRGIVARVLELLQLESVLVVKEDAPMPCH
jgi:anti-sigma B factor antagonist